MAGQVYSSVICAFQPVLLLVYRYNDGPKKGTVRTRKINVEALKNEEIKRTFQAFIHAYMYTDTVCLHIYNTQIYTIQVYLCK